MCGSFFYFFYTLATHMFFVRLVSNITLVFCVALSLIGSLTAMQMTTSPTTYGHGWLMLTAASAAAVPPPPPVYAQVALLRDATHQSADWLAGILAGLHEANTRNTDVSVSPSAVIVTTADTASAVRNHTITLTVHHSQSAAAPQYNDPTANFYNRSLTPDAWAFINNQSARATEASANNGSTPSTSALVGFLEPFYFFSGPVIDAMRASQVPVFNPVTGRSEDFLAAENSGSGRGSPTHVLSRRQTFDTELIQLLTYIQNAHDCARLDILVSKLLQKELADRLIATIRSAYRDYGFPDPSVLWVPAATTATAREFFFFDNRSAVSSSSPSSLFIHRMCFVALLEGSTFVTFMQDIAGDARFVSGDKKIFGLSLLETNFVNGSSTSVSVNPKLFNETYFIREAPPLWLNRKNSSTLSARYQEAFSTWLPRVSSGGGGSSSPDLIYFNTSIDRIPSGPTNVGLSGYLLIRHFLALYELAANRVTGNNPQREADAVAPTGALLTNISYSQKIVIDDFKLFPTIRDCAPAPFPSLCFCNVASRTLYIFRVNPTSGLPEALSDNVTLGQRGVAQRFISSDTCGLTLNTHVFPFRYGLLHQPLSEGVEVYGHALMRSLNYADPAPSRYHRLFVREVPDNVINAKDILSDLVRQVQPFVIIGSAVPVSATSTLMLFNGTELHLEDPVLAPIGSPAWNPFVVNVFPVIADYIHALVLFYAENPGRFTSVQAIASSAQEAALIRRSFHTAQLDVAITMTADTSAWRAYVNRYFSSNPADMAGGSNPFVLATSVDSALLFEAYITFRSFAARGKLALAIREDALDVLRTNLGNINLPTTTASPDIYFASTLDEFWLNESSTRQFMARLGVRSDLLEVPYMYNAHIAYAIAYQLSQQQSVDPSKNAAAALYQAGTLSFGDISVGPFSNESCSADVIAANRRDRTCQCQKGPRRFRVYGLSAWMARTTSAAATSNFRWTMTTCGVHYVALAPPPAASFGTEDLIMLVVPIGFAFLLVTVGVVVFIACCTGRNNWHAPKDPSRAFTIVFTDIQNSTSLWARVPAQMSGAVVQHHDLIRALIRKFKGYEVKTIGDSFMVAFTDPSIATAFSAQLQRDFFEAEWPPEIDAAYKELACEALEDTAAAATLNVSGEVLGATATAATTTKFINDELAYASAWHGVRVRVGVHFGFGDIKKDETSGGYDYYGTVVNTAARVEGVGNGGQTLITDAVMEALLSADSLDAMEVQVVDLGPQPLRGLDQPVRLFQLCPKSLTLRVFAPLRLGVENAVEKQQDESTDTATNEDVISVISETLNVEQLAVRMTAIGAATNAATAGGVSSSAAVAGVSSGELLRFFYFLSTAMTTSTEQWRRETLAHLCKKWHVNTGRMDTRKGSSGNGPIPSASLLQLALKVARAAEAKHHAAMRIHGGGHGGGAGGGESAAVSRTNSLQGRGGGGGGSPSSTPLHLQHRSLTPQQHFSHRGSGLFSNDGSSRTSGGGGGVLSPPIVYAGTPVTAGTRDSRDDGAGPSSSRQANGGENGGGCDPLESVTALSECSQQSREFDGFSVSGGGGGGRANGEDGGHPLHVLQRDSCSNNNMMNENTVTCTGDSCSGTPLRPPAQVRDVANLIHGGQAEYGESCSESPHRASP